MEKHTPGPWIGIDPKTKKFKSTPWTADNERASSTMSAPIKAGQDTVALVVADDWEQKEELHANARLIAAAPELLDALQRVAEWRETLAATQGLSAKSAILEDIDDAIAAIAKATGRES